MEGEIGSGRRETQLSCRQPSQSVERGRGDRKHEPDGVGDRRAGYIWSADGAEDAINVRDTSATDENDGSGRTFK
jgi:hypothetical protein